MPEPSLGRHRRTGSLTWVAAIACAIASTVVIIAGVFVTVVYAVYHPKVPSLTVSSSRLLLLDYDQPSGYLGVKISLTAVAVNPNTRSHASFSDLGMSLRFSRTLVAKLRASPFKVPKRGSFPLAYMVESWAVPLKQGAEAELEAALRRNAIEFDLEGWARTRWRVGVLLRLGFWTRLSCRLLFLPSNGSSVGVDCSSKSHL